MLVSVTRMTIQGSNHSAKIFEVQFVDALEGLLQESEAAEARRKLAALDASRAWNLTGLVLGCVEAKFCK